MGETLSSDVFDKYSSEVDDKDGSEDSGVKVNGSGDSSEDTNDEVSSSDDSEEGHEGEDDLSYCSTCSSCSPSDPPYKLRSSE
jgi:hypothetical protein